MLIMNTTRLFDKFLTIIAITIFVILFIKSDISTMLGMIILLAVYNLFVFVCCYKDILKSDELD